MAAVLRSQRARLRASVSAGMKSRSFFWQQSRREYPLQSTIFACASQTKPIAIRAFLSFAEIVPLAPRRNPQVTRDRLSLACRVRVLNTIFAAPWNARSPWRPTHPKISSKVSREASHRRTVPSHLTNDCSLHSRPAAATERHCPPDPPGFDLRTIADVGSQESLWSLRLGGL